MDARRGTFEFDGYTLDLTRGSLRAGERVIDLRPKCFSALAYLVENAGRLVPKDELIEAVWPDVVVTDESLTKCVSELRAALGEGGQRLVKTVPRRGYMLDAAVAPAVTSDTIPPLQERPGSAQLSARGRLAAIAVAAVLVLVLLGVVAGALPWATGGAGTPDRVSIAVLAFSNEGDARQDYLSSGLTEDLIASLGRFRELFVIGRSSAFAYKGRQLPAEQIGRELGVRYLLEGSVRRDGDKVRITAELIEADTGREIWAESYDRELAESFAVQDEVTRRIVGTLVAHVDRAELQRIASKPPQSLAAYDFYLRGKSLLTMRHGDKRGRMVAEARGLFENALAADPRYAPAKQALAYTYAATFLEPMQDGFFASEWRQPATLGRALSLAREAVELDPYLAEAHATLAWILHWAYRREEAIAEFQRALELNPNLADGRLAHMLVHDGRAGEAVDYMRRVMRQDPFPPPIYFSYLGNAYYMAGRYDAAFETLRQGVERVPDYRAMVVWLAAAAAQSERADAARETAAKVLRMAPDFTIAHWLQHIRFGRAADADRLAEGLRKAGLPE